MSTFGGVNLPKINTENLNNEKYAQMVANYLLELDEHLKYMFSHIEEENMTDQTVKNLTASYINVTNGVNSMILDPETGFKMTKGNKELFVFDILTGDVEYSGKVDITNGDNSMILDPEIGFKMTKGSKNQFFFNIITGDLEYSGKMTGGSIQSPNYEEDVAGMLINLDDGTWDSVGFKYANNSCAIKGSFQSIGPEYTTTINNGKIEATFIDLSFGSISTYAWLSSGGFRLANYDGYVVLDMHGMTWRNNDLTDGYTYLTTKNFQESMGGVYGEFASADGKIVTVADGVITDIS